MDLPDPGVAPLTLLETAAALDGYRWVEAHLFALTGHWATSTSIDELAASWSSRSRRHGWHLEMWEARRPLVGIPVEPPEQLDHALRGLAGVESDRARLTVLDDLVVPKLSAALESHRLRVNPLADATLARTLDMVLADLAADSDEGVAQRRALDTDAGYRTDEPEPVAAVRTVLARAGGLLPPLPRSR